MVDRIDRQIVHCLQRNGRAPFRLLAGIVGVSEQTVARRYRALRDDGAIRVLVIPDAAATGQQTWFVRILCRPDSADPLAEAIASRPDVSWVSVTSGGAELICVTRTDPSAAQASVLSRLPKTSQVLSFTACSVLHMHTGGDSEWMDLDDPLSPEQVRQLSAGATAARGRPAPSSPRRDDTLLLTALAADGRASAATLARLTGWPQSRVSTRIDELLASGTAIVEVDLAPQRFGFNAIAYLWLTVSPGRLAATGEALSLHPQTSFAAAVTGSANLMTAVTCRDAADLYDYVTTKVGALPAVRQAEVVPTLRRVKQAGTLVRGGRLLVGEAPAALVR